MYFISPNLGLSHKMIYPILGICLMNFGNIFVCIPVIPEVV